MRMLIAVFNCHTLRKGVRGSSCLRKANIKMKGLRKLPVYFIFINCPRRAILVGPLRHLNLKSKVSDAEIESRI